MWLENLALAFNGWGFRIQYYTAQKIHADSAQNCFSQWGNEFCVFFQLG